MWGIVLIGVGLSVQTPGVGPLADANELYQRQEYRLAARKYEEALGLDPGLTAPYFYLANSYENAFRPTRRGDPDNDACLAKAEKYYLLAADRITDDALLTRTLQYLAALYSVDKLNDPHKARSIVTRLIEMHPSDLSNYFGLAHLYETAGLTEEAEATLEWARAAAPDSIDPLAQLAELQMRLGEFDRAMALYEEVCRLEPNNPQNHYNVAVRYEEKVRRDYKLSRAEQETYLSRGLAAVDKAVDLRPDYFEAWVYKSLLVRQQAAFEPDPVRQRMLTDQAEELGKRAREIQSAKTRGLKP